MHIIFFSCNMPLSYFKVSKLFKSSLEIIRVNKDKLNLHSFRSGTAAAKRNWYTEVENLKDARRHKIQTFNFF